MQTGAPAGFGKEHYDRTPSPNSLAGGGSTSLLGTGGVLSDLFGANDGPYTYIGSAIGGSRGGITLGSLIRTANRLKNAKRLNTSIIVLQKDLQQKKLFQKL